MIRMPVKSTIIRKLFSPILVERRLENALTVSKWRTKNRTRQTSASPSAIVTAHSQSGRRLYVIMPPRPSTTPRMPRGKDFNVHFQRVDSTTRWVRNSMSANPLPKYTRSLVSISPRTRRS